MGGASDSVALHEFVDECCVYCVVASVYESAFTDADVEWVCYYVKCCDCVGVVCIYVKAGVNADGDGVYGGSELSL